jgi:hypothetical protein
MAGRGFIAADVERPNANLSDPWKYQHEQFTCTGWSGTCLGPFQVLGNIVGRRTPYVHQWLFNIQHELTQNIVVEVGYQGNAGHKLERFRTYNQAVLKTGPNDARSIQQRRPWPAYDRIQQVDVSINSNYHALSAKAQQRFSRGLTYLIGYTWSKAIDGGSAIRTNSGDRLWPTDSYDLSKERGLAQFHVGRRFVASTVYELPFGEGKAMLNKSGFVDALISGWQLGAIVTFADGSPTNIGSIGDSFSVGGHPNWNTPGADARNAATFGKITSARTMREMQFALKYLF